MHEKLVTLSEERGGRDGSLIEERVDVGYQPCGLLRAWLVPWRARAGSYLHSLSPLPQAKIMQLRLFGSRLSWVESSNTATVFGRTQPARLRGNQVPLRFWPGGNFCISWDRPKGACNKPNARAVHQWSQAGGTAHSAYQSRPWAACLLAAIARCAGWLRLLSLPTSVVEGKPTRQSTIICITCEIVHFVSRGP
jgi:hypothetical protein